MQLKRNSLYTDNLMETLYKTFKVYYYHLKIIIQIGYFSKEIYKNKRVKIYFKIYFK
jgi:hypothetical protein